MLDIEDLVNYAHDDCVFDIYNCDIGVVVRKNLTRHEAKRYHETHRYDLISFEPIQRDNVFGLQFNVHKVEEY